MEFVRKQPIGIELVKRGIIDEVDVQKALDYQKEHPSRRIGDILHILNLADPKKLIDAIGEIVGRRAIVLNSNDIKVKPTDYITIDVAEKYKAVPFEVTGGKILVCFADTVNEATLESVRLLMLNKGLVMDPYITFESDVERILKSLQNDEVESIDINQDNSSVTALVDSIIRGGMEKRASDIHFEPQDDSLRVRYRIDGELFTATKISKYKQSQIIGRLKAISNMHQEKQEAQDGRILLYDDYNIRVSSQKNVYGEKFVLRLLKKNTVIRDIFELGFPKDETLLKKIANKRNCMTIVSAPTGEGKTTTLYSIIDYLNSPEINITTIEDPVEIRIEGLNQVEIDERTRFADSLRTVLRQDPDVILVGEIRDTETAEIAIQAGQTGHYVLSTIHTIDAIEVITRLRKMGLSDYDIASTVATTISQRLVRTLCPKCKKERDFTKEEIQKIEKIGKEYGVEFKTEGLKTYDAVGCKYCNKTGYFDRIGLFEILEFNDDIKELVMKGASSIEIKRKAQELGYKPILVDGVKKVLDGHTTFDEVRRKLAII